MRYSGQIWAEMEIEEDNTCVSRSRANTGRDDRTVNGTLNPLTSNLLLQSVCHTDCLH